LGPEQDAVVARAKELIDFARQQGYTPDEIARMIEQTRMIWRTEALDRQKGQSI
jgi:hypothetical protein